MRYKPRFTSARDLLMELGYKSENRGYANAYDRSGCRFHGLIEIDGTINLHRDKIVSPTVHTSSKFGSKVDKEIRRIRKADRAHASKVLRFFWSLLSPYVGEWD